MSLAENRIIRMTLYLKYRPFNANLSPGLRLRRQGPCADFAVFHARFLSGLYQNSETLLEDFAVEGGYLIKPLMVEVVTAYEIQNADNYDKYWTRFSGGINYYIEKHDIKLQTTYRVGENKDGVDGNDVDELFVQVQYLF